MGESKVNRAFILILSVLIFLVITVFTMGAILTKMESSQPEIIVFDYCACVGITVHGVYIYDWCVENYGEPDCIETVPLGADKLRFRKDVFFDKLQISFIVYGEDTEQSRWVFSYVTTYDPQHSFTADSVHVGSTREEVLEAYSRSEEIISDEHSDRILDGGYDNYVVFSYDDNDIVISITFDASM